MVNFEECKIVSSSIFVTKCPLPPCDVPVAPYNFPYCAKSSPVYFWKDDGWYYKGHSN